MADLLRSTAAFPQFSTALEVALVEISPALREVQRQRLGCGGVEGTEKAVSALGAPREGGDGGESDSGGRGIPVQWSASLEGVPGGPEAPPTIYLAHEFLDALPVHQFAKTGEYFIVLLSVLCLHWVISWMHSSI
jgi:NADH dehydrogenase [ubiquinone] 1 alpha subcomplex assembly factor 7